MRISSNKISAIKKSCHCKTVSDFSFDLYESITTVNSEHWNNIVKFGSEFMQIPYLTVLEKERPKNLHFHYAIIYKAQNPIAIAYFQVVDLNSPNFDGVFNQENEESGCLVKGYIKKYLTNHLIRSVDKENIRILVCGNIFISGEHGFVYSPGSNEKEMFDSFAEVIDSISSIEKIRGGKIQ